MALFNKKEGGLMDAIRCDEPEYLIWKWRPAGADGADTRKENAIRWGSSLRVKDGEVAVFVYRQKDGVQQDFIEGPFDETIKTANFPVLASIIGAAFGGGTPFQAEVYFINLAGIIQIKFGVPYFDVVDPRYMDLAVPVAVRGTITFKIAEYKAFIKLHRLIGFDLEAFKLQIRDGVIKYVKGVVTNIPSENGIPLVQLERKILQINEIIESHLKPRLLNDFGVAMSAMDIANIEVDKESENFGRLQKLTQNIVEQTTLTQAGLNLETMKTMNDLQLKNAAAMQGINTQNMAETARIQREEGQYAQHMQTDIGGLALHQLRQQEAIAVAAAGAMGEMGKGAGVNLGGGGTGFNPGAMMAGMAMGNTVGQGMAGMMGNVFQQMPGMTPPASGAVPPVPGSPVPPPLPSAPVAGAKFCANCGAPLAEGQKFCPSCGAKAGA
jgi:membrane protease subunit (stomatin/prohibitin family)